MPTKITGLYIGKFQPFHNGHLFAVKNILPQVDRLVIVIGSSQYSNLIGQPFSAEERCQMIKQSLVTERLNRCTIVAVPDIHDDKNWVEHLRGYVKQFDLVFTNNKPVARLFERKGFDVRAIPVLPGISGTLVRQKLANEEPDWSSLVPVAIAKVILSSPTIHSP